MKIQAEIDKVKAKISEQQARLKELEQKKLEAENSEIVDIVRGMSISRAYSNGCKSLTSPNSGNRIANSKGVHREVESERSWRQTSDLTHRNFIQGI